MPEVKVRIEKVALGQLIASAYAVYRRETEGNLFGRVHRNDGQTRLVIEGALPSRLTKRRRRAAKPDKREYPRILAVCEPIGWFHSHVPTWEKNGNSRYLDAGRVALSETDIVRLRDMRRELRLLLH
jgi:hypothetical protein